ncbi:hypothetical protein [Pseudonocardia yunnanensis]|uniref:Uncharacterized protein n=1 Tax=Pseudonocardia yunnanensis TaxID=58107 RepID=A0ABW4F024_9PSEU
MSPNIYVVASPSMSMSVSETVVVERRRTAHGFHLVMTLLTGGAWGLFVWLPLVLIRRRR